MYPNLGIGLGLRPPHYAQIFNGQSEVSWFEAVSENYMGIGEGGGPPLEQLEKVRADFPIVLHGVSLSIGSCDPLDHTYLKNLKDLASRIQPQWISDHLCWTGVNGENLHDLLPLPYTEEVIRHLVGRIQEAQDRLRTPLVLGKGSSY